MVEIPIIIKVRCAGDGSGRLEVGGRRGMRTTENEMVSAREKVPLPESNKVSAQGRYDSVSMLLGIIRSTESKGV